MGSANCKNAIDGNTDTHFSAGDGNHGGTKTGRLVLTLAKPMTCTVSDAWLLQCQMLSSSPADYHQCPSPPLLFLYMHI